MYNVWPKKKKVSVLHLKLNHVGLVSSFTSNLCELVLFYNFTICNTDTNMFDGLAVVLVKLKPPYIRRNDALICPL